MSHITQLKIFKLQQEETPSFFSYLPSGGLKFLIGKSDSLKSKIEIETEGGNLTARYIKPEKEPMVKILRYGMIAIVTLSTARYLYAHSRGEIKTVKEIYKEKYGKELVYIDCPFENTQTPEWNSTERAYEDRMNSEAYDRVQEGNARGDRDFERASDYERDHMA